MDMLLSQSGVRLDGSETEIDESTLEFKQLLEISSCLEKSDQYFLRFSSYKLKHIFERYLKDVTNGLINHVHNGEFIRAMEIAGFSWKRCSPNSRNVYFKILSRSLKPFECYFNMGPKVKSEKSSSEEQIIE